MSQWCARASQLASYVPSVTAPERGSVMSYFPTRILVATEGSEEAELAATAAAELAKSTNSELHVIHVSEPGAEISLNPAYSLNRDLLDEPLRELERQGRHLLNGQVKKIEEAGGTVAEAHLRIGSRPDHEIILLAEELDAGMIAMGSRGFGPLKRVLMGSVSESVVRHAHCPVTVARK
jgi:nucleotide-binding universal stress UspA family protein